MLGYCENSLVLEDEGRTCLSNIQGMCACVKGPKKKFHHVLLIPLFRYTYCKSHQLINLWHNLLNTVFERTVATFRGGVGGPAGPALAGPLFSGLLVSFPDCIGTHMLLNTHAYTTCSC